MIHRRPVFTQLSTARKVTEVGKSVSFFNFYLYHAVDNFVYVDVILSYHCLCYRVCSENANNFKLKVLSPIREAGDGSLVPLDYEIQEY